MKTTILGAIAGDIIGSLYEFHSTRNYNFNMFDKRMRPTDDSIMTVAIAYYTITGLAMKFCQIKCENGDVNIHMPDMVASSMRG